LGYPLNNRIQRAPIFSGGRWLHDRLLAIYVLSSAGKAAGVLIAVSVFNAFFGLNGDSTGRVYNLCAQVNVDCYYDKQLVYGIFSAPEYYRAMYQRKMRLAFSVKPLNNSNF